MKAFVAIFLITLTNARPRFHEDLTDDERLHYFGTASKHEVPEYEYVTPRRAPRHKRDISTDVRYILNALGEEINLVLSPNLNLLSPGCLVSHIKSNRTEDVYPCTAREDGHCYFLGSSENHNGSWASLSICSGLQGLISIPGKQIIVQPVREGHIGRVRRDTLLADPHIAYQYSSHRKSCAAKAVEEPSIEVPSGRQKRATNKKYIETLVVVDPPLYKFHGKDTERFVKTVLNIVAHTLLDPSLPAEIYLSLTKLIILEQDQDGLDISDDSDSSLSSFCHWQTQQNPDSESDPKHADYAILISRVRPYLFGPCALGDAGSIFVHRRDLKHEGNANNVGLGYSGGLCMKNNKCSINEDGGLGTGLTLAHETGHTLGMNHDHDGNECPDNRYIMATIGASGADALKWSSCSVADARKYLSSSGASCLNDAPPKSNQAMYTSTKPGTVYPAVEQCKLLFGHNSDVCYIKDGQDVCYQIACMDRRNGSNTCKRSSAPMMDGTECGTGKWCIKSSCVAMGAKRPAAVNGGWSAWDSHFTPCSRTCGGGVKIKRRTCSNPYPRYGGTPCHGQDTMAQICNIQPCSISQYGYKAEQCAATDNEPLQGQRYHWIPDVNLEGDISCTLQCNAEGYNLFHLRGYGRTFNDGTDCLSGRNNPYSRCVEGKCRSFGCDGHIDSARMFDPCGVCNGRGDTCRKISGTFNKGRGKVFTTFVTIPKGSTGVKITQGNSYCYLSMLVNGDRLFNDGPNQQSGEFTRDGVTVKYNSRATPERLEITGPLPVAVQAQVYRKYGAGFVGVDPDIHYKYHVPNGRSTGGQYRWSSTPGTCSKQCGTGMQIPIISCKNGNSIVEDYLCNLNLKPSEVEQPCNRQPCPPRWKSEPWGTCTKTCGGGQRQRAVSCVRENNNVEEVLQAQQCRGQSKPSTVSQCNTQTCPGVWKPGAWSSCSQSCANGIQTRTVKCYHSVASTTPIADSECLSGQKPETKQSCFERPCRLDVSGAACADKGCSGYGESVCYDYRAWAGEHCMKTCRFCVADPNSYSHGSGSSVDPSCQDTDDCASYGSTVCTEYREWSQTHCKQTCHFCQGSSSSGPSCKDKSSDCAAYGPNVCTEYAEWAKENCKKHCKICGGGSSAASTSASTVHNSSGHLCINLADCAGFTDIDICTNKKFAYSKCRKYCNLCDHSSGCHDKDSDCASYASNMCVDYRPWATEHCAAYCALCNQRSKRSVPFYKKDVDMIPRAPPKKVEAPALEQPMIPRAPPTDVETPPLEPSIAPRSPPTDVETLPLEPKAPPKEIKTLPQEPPGVPRSPPTDIETLLLEPKAPPTEVERTPLEPPMVPRGPPTEQLTPHIVQKGPSTELGAPPKEDQDLRIPPVPLCNTVRTAPSGSLDTLDQLPAGTTCVQTIMVPSNQRVLLKITDVLISCTAGDKFIMYDLEKGQHIPVCSRLLQNEWLSAGSIVGLEFKVAVEGHGFRLAYESFPKNLTSPECSHHMTAVAGSFSSGTVVHPDGTVCDLYIVASPGNKVKVILDALDLATNNNCEDSSVTVEDLQTNKKEVFCGEDEQFVWISEGSNVRIKTSGKMSRPGAYMASYMLQDL